MKLRRRALPITEQPTIDEARCADCVFGDPYLFATYHCHRTMPGADPRIRVEGGDSNAAWPVVRKDDWCGEFVKAKPE